MIGLATYLFAIAPAHAQITELLNDINPSGNSDPTEFVELDGEFFFRANDGVNGEEWWKTDGTAAGAVLVKDIFTRFSWIGHR